MKLLQVTPSKVYPPNRGGEHRSHGIVSQFSQHGDHVYRFAQTSELKPRVDIEIEEGYWEISDQSRVRYLIKFPIAFDLPNVFSNIALRRLPTGRLEKLVNWADIVLVEGPWQFAAIDEMTESTPTVLSSHNLEVERYSNSSGSFVTTWFDRRLEKIERTAVEHADLIICTSSRDEANIREKYDVTSDVLVAPNGTYSQSTDTVHKVERETFASDMGYGPDDVFGIFVGSGQPPNVTAVEFLLDKLDEIDERFKLILVGEVCNKVESNSPNVRMEGFVDDLSYYLTNSDIALNPMLTGSGTNIKLLDYMAHGIPVITTDFGARGFNITHLEHALVVSDTEFTQELNKLIDDSELQDKIGTQGSQLVSEHYTWDQISSNLREDLVKYIGA